MLKNEKQFTENKRFTYDCSEFDNVLKDIEEVQKEFAIELDKNSKLISLLEKSVSERVLRTRYEP